MANGGIIGKVNNPTSTTATGVWQQEEQYEAKVTDTWPQRALFTTKSLRFNDPSNDYLNRTPDSAGNRKTWTFSCWVKRGLLSGSSSYGLFGGGDGAGNPRMYCQFDDDTIILDQNSTGNTWGNERLITNRLFRDVSAWYHIVIVLDTTQGTASNRQKIYVNGVQETSFSTAAYPSQNTDMPFNNNVASSVGSIGGTSSNIFDGYMAEVCFIDGTALDPTSFGVANSDGVWTPIPYTGTFGNNGFNLQFENSAALGTDSSPNGNTFTVNNLTSIDQSTDYPVVNYSTWNPLAKYLYMLTLSEGNTKAISAATNNPWYSARATIGFTSGKWFWETKFTGSTNPVPVYIGVVDESARMNIEAISENGTTMYYNGSGGEMRVDGTNTSNDYGNFSTSDICGIAVNADDNLITIYKNGSAIVTNYALSTTRTGFLFPVIMATNTSDGTNSNGVITNFGSPPYAISSSNADGNGYGNFEYAVPSGYYALNTANLAEFG